MAGADGVNGAAAALDFEALRQIGDPKADALIDRFIASSGATDMQATRLDGLLQRLFVWNPAATTALEPPEVEAFLRDTSEVPAFDAARVARAQDLFERYRLTGLLVLGCASLPHCYAHGEIANTLTVSGMLGMRVRQRIQDTADFVEAVMKPGSLVDRSAVPWIRKVRLIHATMRKLTLLTPASLPAERKGSALAEFLLMRDWDTKDGMPLDQVELTYVLLTFSYVVLQGWRSLRLIPGAQEEKDYLYTWSLVGSMLGVKDELLAPLRDGSAAGAGALFGRIKAFERGTELGKDPRAKEKGRLLTATLNVLLTDSVLRAKLPAVLSGVKPAADPLLRNLPRSLIRRLIGCVTAGELWVDRPPLLHWFVHLLIIELVGFTDFTATFLGKRISERGMWANISFRFHDDVAKQLGRRPPRPNAPPAQGQTA
jgi:hypothetical protein